MCACVCVLNRLVLRHYTTSRKSYPVGGLLYKHGDWGVGHSDGVPLRECAVGEEMGTWDRALGCSL